MTPTRTIGAQGRVGGTVYLAKLKILNFRKLRDVELSFQAGLNVLVGSNNVGKTAVVDALRALLAGHDEPYPREITKLEVGLDNGCVYFCYSDNERTRKLNTELATRLVHRLGGVGAYTHNLGRYWCYRTLLEQPGILRALVRRYPHILIDEAQDIGTLHQAIIEQLIGAGCQVSLIGDPNQGIYEFAGANGAFLSQYGGREGVDGLGLTRNFRSVPSVLDLANRLATRADTAERAAPTTPHGAFFVAYRNAERENLIAAFRAAVLAAELKLERSAVLCRGREMADRLAGNEGAQGQGIVKSLAQAAILRDGHQDYLGAFKLVVAAVVGLLANPPQGLIARITQPARYPDERTLRRLIWSYTRAPDSGLPSATLTGNAQWHSLLLERTRALLTRIAQDHGLASADNLGSKLGRRGLLNAPLMAAVDLVENEDTSHIRVNTVHQAKGESLDAVLYLANREHTSALLAGVDTEVGRIGYVAVAAALRKKNPKLPPVFSLRHLAHLSGVDYGFLRAVIGRKAAPNDYRIFRIHKRSSSRDDRRYRVIAIPSPDLLKVQRWITQEILSRVPVHSASVAFAKGSRLVEAASPHCECKWLIKLDVRSFFESINEIAVYRVFENLGYQPLVAFELTRLCTRMPYPESSV